MAWIEGFSNSNKILESIGKAITKPVDEKGIFHENDKWELVYPSPASFKQVREIENEQLFSTDLVNYKCFNKPILETDEPVVMINGVVVPDSDYLIDKVNGIVTFVAKKQPSDTVLCTYKHDDDGIESALNIVGTPGTEYEDERIVFKTTTYPVTITPAERLQNDIIDPSLNTDALTMYVEIQKPKYLINPETGLASYKDFNGSMISTSRNQHHILTRTFDNYIENVHVELETAVPDAEFKVYTLANKNIVKDVSFQLKRNGILLSEGSGDKVIVDGTELKASLDFLVGASTDQTASALAQVIATKLGTYDYSVSGSVITLTQKAPSADILDITMAAGSVGVISTVSNTITYEAPTPAEAAVKEAINAPALNINYSTSYSGQTLVLNGKTVALTRVLALNGSVTPVAIDQLISALQGDIDAVYDGVANGALEFTVGNDNGSLTIQSSTTGASASVNLSGSSPGISGALGFTDLAAFSGVAADPGTKAVFQFEITTNFAGGEYQLDTTAGTVTFPAKNNNIDVITASYTYKHCGPVPDRLDAYGNVLERGAHSSDWAKFSWFNDWEEVNHDFEDGDVGIPNLAEGLIVRQVEIPNLVDGIPIQFWLSINKNRLCIVLMGEPSIDDKNYLCSFGYFGKLEKLPKSVNDTAGNFAMTVGSSTVPAMLGTIPREKAVITKVEEDLTVGGNHEGDHTYAYMVTFITDGGESAASNPMAVFSSSATPNVAIKLTFKTPLYAKGWKIYRQKVSGDITNTPAITNLASYKLVSRSNDVGGQVTWIDADASITEADMSPSYYGVPTPGVIRDALFGLVQEVRYSNRWGLDTATGVADIAMFKTRGGAYYQRHRIAFTTPEEFMSKNAFNPSRWTGHFHLSQVNIVHPYDGYRGILDSVLAVDSASIAPLDELTVDKGKVEIVEKEIIHVDLPALTTSLVFDDFDALAQSMKLVGKLPNTSAQATSGSEQVGVLIDAPFNKVIIKDTLGLAPKTAAGDDIYGRLSWDVAKTAFRIDLFAEVEGVETAAEVNASVSDVTLTYKVRENVEKYYKYFTINAPHSMLTNGPNASYGLAIKKA